MLDFHDPAFESWIRGVRTESFGGRTLISTHEVRPNNWGTHAGASRLAVALYLGDSAELDRCVEVFRGWLGDRASYASFEWGDLSWQLDASAPVGVNREAPKCVISRWSRSSIGICMPSAVERSIVEIGAAT